MDKILNLYKQGLSLNKIEKKLSINVHKLSKYLKQLGIEVKAPRRISPQEKNNIIDLYLNKNFSVVKISQHLGIERHTVSRILKENNINIKHYKTTLWQRNILIPQLYEKYNCYEIARKIGIHPSSVWSILNYRNVKMRNNSECQRKYTLNESYFEKIDTNSKAYWLGFVVADGNVCRRTLKIILKAKDKNHLEKFRKSIDSNALLKYVYRTINCKNFSYIKLEFNSKKLTKDIARWGVVPNKTYKTYFPPIHHCFYRDFIRGVFDGDVSVGISKTGKRFFTICGNHELIHTIQQILNQECNLKLKKLSSRKIKKGINFSFRYCGKKEFRRIFYFLYTNVNIEDYLDRKYETFTNIINNLKL